MNEEIDNVMKKVYDKTIDKYSQIIFNKLIKKYIDRLLNTEGLKFFLDKNTTLNSNEKSFILQQISKLRENDSFEYFTKSNKMISIIIPTYNGINLLIHTINNILFQSYKNLEIIIVDDCSTDNTGEILKENFESYTNIKYIKNEENLDVGKSRLIGYNLSQGEYVIFMDQDDFYIDNNFFLKSINLFNEYKEASFVVGDTLIYNEKSKKIIIHELNLPFDVDRSEYFLKLQSNGYPKPTSTFPVIYKKSNLEKLKIKDINYIGDSTIYQRALLLGQPIILNHIIGVYRIHETNSTKSVNAKFIIDTLESNILTKYLAIKEYNYDYDIMENWISLKANISINWFLNTRNASHENASILLEYVQEKNINISEDTRKRLLLLLLK